MCAGPLRVQEKYILFARRQGQKRPVRGSAGLTRVPRRPRTLLISCDAGGSQTAFIRKQCGPIVWHGSTRVDALEGLLQDPGELAPHNWATSLPDGLAKSCVCRVARATQKI